jgi:hypothetical protein
MRRPRLSWFATFPGVLALALLAAGCSGSEGSSTEDTPTTVPPSPTAEPTATATPTPAPPTITPAPPSPTPTLYPDHYELPDLQTLPPTDFHITGPESVRTLRFSSHVVNLGIGPLILIGSVEQAEGRVHAIQRIRTTTGEMEEREIGYFVWFGWHGHWHFEDFNLFELWTYDDDGEPVELLATNGKASWCITETGIHQPLPEVYDEYAILGGCDSEMQALATGWVDTYESDLHGQELDLTGIPDGRYAFVSTVNPDGRILELDDSKNQLIVYLEISGYNVRVLDGP